MMSIAVRFSRYFVIRYSDFGFIVFFFFKQKTAYEMRISDWSSDVCSSDLLAAKSEAVSRKLGLAELAQAFTLPWSAYVRLLVVKDDHARQFYEVEALRGGWSVRQLDRQINSQFYERPALSQNKAAMMVQGAVPQSEDAVTAANAGDREKGGEGREGAGLV